MSRKCMVYLMGAERDQRRRQHASLTGPRGLSDFARRCYCGGSEVDVESSFVQWDQHIGRRLEAFVEAMLASVFG
jgi:hypothetical protein